MKQTKGTIATTSFIDKNGFQLTRQALEGMVEQINGKYIPYIIEHDPRIAPIGRSISAHLKELGDGHYSVVSTTELFEPDNLPLLVDDGRQMPIRSYSKPIALSYDYSYANEEDKKLIEEIAKNLDAETNAEGKRSSEPISVLIFAFTITSLIAGGILNQIGVDLYNITKQKIKTLFSRKRKSDKDHLLIFQIIVQQEDKSIEFNTILENPSDEDIDNLIPNLSQKMEKIIPKVLEEYSDVSKFVFDYKNKELEPKFAVRKDAVPLSIGQELNTKLDALLNWSEKE